MVRQTREAMVRAMGVKMHAKRPALPILVEACQRSCRVVVIGKEITGMDNRECPRIKDERVTKVMGRIW